MTDINGAPTLGAVARLIRSKNAGPFWTTIDIFFPSQEDYDSYHDEITPARIAAIYGVDAGTIKVFGLPRLLVTKLSFPRAVAQGGPFERDMHAGQQFVPLLSLSLGGPVSLTSGGATTPDVADTIPQ
ncbi:MAG TPA: DUF4387 domain-containing protein [Candidatus Solibacter sp.]|nr:DUF4387 domain-containing protein [Candidatus Solibacter sp.]